MTVSMMGEGGDSLHVCMKVQVCSVGEGSAVQWGRRTHGQKGGLGPSRGIREGQEVDLQAEEF